MSTPLKPPVAPPVRPTSPVTPIAAQTRPLTLPVGQGATLGVSMRASAVSANSVLVYGPTGSYKTSQLGRAAWYIYEKYGQITRLISADGGGWDPILPEIEAGIIEPFNLLTTVNPLGTLKKIYDGNWPKVDGKNRSYVMEDWDKSNVGMICVESLTSISQMLMADAIDKGRKMSEEIVARFDEEGETFGIGGRSHVGFVQGQINNMLIGFKSLPLKKVIFTALEYLGEDAKKRTVIGPAIIGSAMTGNIGGKVGDMLHFSPTTEKSKDKSGKDVEEIVVRGYFSNHPGPFMSGPVWPSKVRNATELSHKFKDYFKGEEFFTMRKFDYSMGLDKFFAAQDAIMAMGGESARKRREEIDSRRNGSSGEAQK